MLYAFLAILSGMLISGQSSCNGLLYPFIGVIAVGFVSQLLNAVTSFFFSLIYFHRPPRLKGLPFYDYFGGVCAMFVLGFSGYLVAHLGTAVTVCLSVSGQLFMSAIVDHFGWFGSEKVPFKARRLPGFFCILAGVFVINFAGANTFQGISGRGFLFLLLIFAILVGCVTVFARMFNFEASKYVGKLDGNFANAGFGSIVSFIIYLISVKGQLSFSGFASAPALGYLDRPHRSDFLRVKQLKLCKNEGLSRHYFSADRTDLRRDPGGSDHVQKLPSWKADRHSDHLRRDLF